MVPDRYPTHSLEIVDTADAPRIARRFVRDVMIAWGVIELGPKPPPISDVVAQSIVASDRPQLTIEMRCRGDSGVRVSVQDRRRSVEDDAAPSPAVMAILRKVAADFGVDVIQHEDDLHWFDVASTMDHCVPGEVPPSVLVDVGAMTSRVRRARP
jgi:hypothetical protein